MNAPVVLQRARDECGGVEHSALLPYADAPGESGLRKEKADPRHAATGIGSHELRRQAYFSCRLCGREQKSPVNTGRNASEKVTREAYFRVSYASGVNLREGGVNLREKA